MASFFFQCQFWQVFVGISFKNIAFCKIFCNVFMNKCSFANKPLVSIKVLYKLNSFLAHCCQHHWLQRIVLVFLGGTAKWTSIFGGMLKLVGIFWGVKFKARCEPMQQVK